MISPNFRLPCYFMRSQKRTYATDAAKNAMVTAIQRTSCMGKSPLVFRNPASLKSESDSLAGSERDFSQLHFRIHFYELCPPPGRIELRKVNVHGAGWRSHSFFDESGQHAQQKCHRTDAQHCQRNFHSVTGRR